MINSTVTNTTPAEKGAKFLRWVVEHEREMRKALRKNCTYDPDLFDDVYNEVIINVFNTITNNNREPANIKHYFYSSLIFLYRARQNRKRKTISKVVRDEWENIKQLPDTNDDKEARESGQRDAVRIMRDALVEQYGEKWADIFIDYWTGRTQASASYRQTAISYGVSVDQVKERLQEMRQYVVEECRYLRQSYQYANN